MMSARIEYWVQKKFLGLHWEDDFQIHNSNEQVCRDVFTDEVANRKLATLRLIKREVKTTVIE